MVNAYLADLAPDKPRDGRGPKKGAAAVALLARPPRDRGHDRRRRDGVLLLLGLIARPAAPRARAADADAARALAPRRVQERRRLAGPTPAMRSSSRRGAARADPQPPTRRRPASRCCSSSSRIPGPKSRRRRAARSSPASSGAGRGEAFEAREGFRLTLGNAGGVRVTVDGRAARAARAAPARSSATSRCPARRRGARRSGGSPLAEPRPRAEPPDLLSLRPVGQAAARAPRVSRRGASCRSSATTGCGRCSRSWATPTRRSAAPAARDARRTSRPTTWRGSWTTADPTEIELDVVSRHSDDPFVLERVIRHRERRTTDSAAPGRGRSAGAPQEALIVNQVRLLRQPALIDALLENPDSDGRRPAAADRDAGGVLRQGDAAPGAGAARPGGGGARRARQEAAGIVFDEADEEAAARRTRPRRPRPPSPDEEADSAPRRRVYRRIARDDRQGEGRARAAGDARRSAGS